MAAGTKDSAGKALFHPKTHRNRSPDMTVMIQVEAAGQRLDHLLSQLSLDHSRSHFKRIIQEHGVLVNGLPTKPSHVLKAGDLVLVWLPLEEAQQLLDPQPLPLEIVYEDEDIVVVNKEPGIVVHPGPGHSNGTLVHGLLAHCSRLASQGAPLRPGIVHRLDRDTSGLLVVAKTDSAYLNLIWQFKQRRVMKEYLALVYGGFTENYGEIRTGFQRHPADRKKMGVAVLGKRDAFTRWQMERDWKDIALLRVKIETGRTHQIRVHLSHIHHPVVGDSVYGGGKRRAKTLKSSALQEVLLKAERQMLHAWHLTIHHPKDQRQLHFTAPIPGDFAVLLRQIESTFQHWHTQ
jgi:23S rRNA pseudouridine1911/1915/1917 synthase